MDECGAAATSALRRPLSPLFQKVMGCLAFCVGLACPTRQAPLSAGRTLVGLKGLRLIPSLVLGSVSACLQGLPGGR